MSFSDSGAPSAVYGKKHRNHFPVDAFNTGIRMSPAAKSPMKILSAKVANPFLTLTDFSETSNSEIAVYVARQPLQMPVNVFSRLA